MGKKLIIFLIGFVLVLPLASVLLYTFFQPNTSFAFRQVLAIAPPEKITNSVLGTIYVLAPDQKKFILFPSRLAKWGLQTVFILVHGNTLFTV